MKSQGQIISASRRTDIPAHFSRWFLQRLREGYALVRQPYSGRIGSVSLLPEDIHSIVFWSKNPSPLLGHLGDVEKVSPRLFFHITLTGVPRVLEPGTPPETEVMHDIRFLAKRYSPDHVVWRFDPIVLTADTPFAEYEARFSRMAEVMRGHVRRCVVSFVHPYQKVLSRFKSSGQVPVTPASRERARLALRLSELAGRAQMALHACCNDEILSRGAVRRASCIDGGYLAGLFGAADRDGRAAPTRRGCGCTRSIDIGGYNTCRSGCVYCYACDSGPGLPVGEDEPGMGFGSPVPGLTPELPEPLRPTGYWHHT